MEDEITDILKEVTESEYKEGFYTDIETEYLPKGLNEDIIRTISEKKGEPDWLLRFRLDAYRHWLTMKMPDWAHLTIPPIDYQDIVYYAAPKRKTGPGSMDEVDPELLRTFERLGIPLEERKILSGVAVDAVMDSVSVKTTFKEELSRQGIIFCSITDAVKEHPDLVRQYLGSDDPSWEKHEKPHRIERYFCRDIPEFIPQPGESNPERGQFPQSFTMRQPVDRRQMRGAHIPLHGHRQ